MNTKKTPIKVEFAPGAFDQFEGTQEELDELVAEIQNMFANKTREEIKSMSRPIDVEDLAKEDPKTAKKILQTLNDNQSSRKIH
jgi:hypothetical protein